MEFFKGMVLGCLISALVWWLVYETAVAWFLS